MNPLILKKPRNIAALLWGDSWTKQFSAHVRGLGHQFEWSVRILKQNPRRIEWTPLSEIQKRIVEGNTISTLTIERDTLLEEILKHHIKEEERNEEEYPLKYRNRVPGFTFRCRVKDSNGNRLTDAGFHVDFTDWREIVSHQWDIRRNKTLEANGNRGANSRSAYRLILHTETEVIPPMKTARARFSVAVDRDAYEAGKRFLEIGPEFYCVNRKQLATSIIQFPQDLPYDPEKNVPRNSHFENMIQEIDHVHLVRAFSAQWSPNSKQSRFRIALYLDGLVIEPNSGRIVGATDYGIFREIPPEDFTALVDALKVGRAAYDSNDHRLIPYPICRRVWPEPAGRDLPFRDTPPYP